jgi:BMFP domain-containing protein YqiC
MPPHTPAMQTQNKIFEDLSRVASGALGSFTNLKQELDALVRDRLERILGDMDIPSREELEVARAMAAKARDEQEKLIARVAELENRVAELESAKESRPARKTTRKAPQAKKSS